MLTTCNGTILGEVTDLLVARQVAWAMMGSIITALVVLCGFFIRTYPGQFERFCSRHAKALKAAAGGVVVVIAVILACLHQSTFTVVTEERFFERDVVLWGNVTPGMVCDYAATYARPGGNGEWFLVDDQPFQENQWQGSFRLDRIGKPPVAVEPGDKVQVGIALHRHDSRQINATGSPDGVRIMRFDIYRRKQR